jgi:hypothetical protein
MYSHIRKLGWRNACRIFVGIQNGKCPSGEEEGDGFRTISFDDGRWMEVVRVPVGSRIFTSPCRPDRLWGPPNLLSNGYRG